MTRLPQQQLTALRAEITRDAALRGLSHVEIADRLKDRDREVPAESIDTGLLAVSVAKADREALSQADQDHLSFLVSASSGTLPLTATLKNDLDAMFSTPSDTKTNLRAVLRRKGSRLDELNLPSITESDVADALRE